MMDEYVFKGTCCSLADDTSNGGCIVTVAGGNCFYEPRDTKCDIGEDCLPKGTMWVSSVNQECPLSNYSPFAKMESMASTLQDVSSDEIEGSSASKSGMLASMGTLFMALSVTFLR